MRHGESEGNVRDEINDNPARIVNLTARGRSQAEAAAEQLRDMPITHAYSSQFPRAQQTAAIVMRGRGMDINTDARLNERLSGLDGQHVDEFRKLVRDDYLHSRPPLGESFVQQMERVRGFLDEIAARYPDGVVLAVSHENPVVAALCLTSPDPGQTALRSVANCEWVVLDWSTA